MQNINDFCIWFYCLSSNKEVTTHYLVLFRNNIYPRCKFHVHNIAKSNFIIKKLNSNMKLIQKCKTDMMFICIIIMEYWEQVKPLYPFISVKSFKVHNIKKLFKRKWNARSTESATGKRRTITTTNIKETRR